LMLTGVIQQKHDNVVKNLLNLFNNKILLCIQDNVPNN